MRKIVFEEDGECVSTVSEYVRGPSMNDGGREWFVLNMYEENYARSERSLALFYCDILQKMVKYT